MQKQVGLFEAKTKSSQLAEEVRRTGEAITLTKRGLPRVDVVPHRRPEVKRRSKSKALAELAKLRKELPKFSRRDILDNIRSGRR